MATTVANFVLVISLRYRLIAPASCTLKPHKRSENSGRFSFLFPRSTSHDCVCWHLDITPISHMMDMC